MSIVVSLIVPSLGETTDLARLFHSVNSQEFELPTEIILALTHPDPQTVTRKLPTLKNNIHLQLISVQRPGIAAARNEALRAARGDVLLFLDDDFTFMTIFKKSGLSVAVGSAGSGACLIMPPIFIAITYG